MGAACDFGVYDAGRWDTAVDKVGFSAFLDVTLVLIGLLPISFPQKQAAFSLFLPSFLRWEARVQKISSLQRFYFRFPRQNGDNARLSQVALPQ